MDAELRSGVESLLRAGGLRLDEDDWRLLAKEADQITDSDKPRIESIMEGLFKGFIALGSKGHEFVPSSQIRERFGKTLRANYPEANEVFLRFATTYWTFKLWLQDQERRTSSSAVVGGLLATLEEQVAALFFPTPGPAKIPPQHREAKQREILRDYGAAFDIDEFIRGNPILIRDRQQGGGSGCGSAVVIIGALAAAATAII